MTDAVLQTVPLGLHWPTIDPFLFCAHHDDHYPAANGSLGPNASLAGRNLGMDFGGIDGWNMYHGATVPGFPQHPHRGFETVTIAQAGLIDHADSLGAVARFGRGDVQWVTAGRGIVHSEMFPLLDPSAPNPVELFQIWLNLPAADKLADPSFTMLWDRDIPRVMITDEAGRGTEISLIAGELDGVHAPPPPPSSWAARPDAFVAIWLIRMEPGAEWELPPVADPRTNRTLYCYEGATLDVGGTGITRNTAAVLNGESIALSAGDEAVECLLLAGRPIGEPVEQHGPFVMNTRAELEQAFSEYQATGFGGWPWPADDPTHGMEPSRFARHADGRIESVG